MKEVIEFKDSRAHAGFYFVDGENWLKCSGRYVRESDYNALLHDKLAIEGRVNQLVDNYAALLERHRRLKDKAEAALPWVGAEPEYSELMDALAEEE